MGARYLSRRSQYMDGVPNGVFFPKFLRPKQIAEVKRRKETTPDRGWYDLIDQIILESSISDPIGLRLLSVLD